MNIQSSLLYRGLESLVSVWEELVKYLVSRFLVYLQQYTEKSDNSTSTSNNTINLTNNNIITSNTTNTKPQQWLQWELDSNQLFTKQIDMMWQLFDGLVQWNVCDPYLVKWVG